MGKNDKEQRVYSKEFKAEAAALAEKREKPISRIADDWGVNESVLRRWMQQAREAAQGGLPPVSRPRTAPGRGVGPVEEREQGAPGGGVKLRFTRNPKKSGRTLVRVIFAQTEPR